MGAQKCSLKGFCTGSSSPPNFRSDASTLSAAPLDPVDYTGFFDPFSLEQGPMTLSSPDMFALSAAVDNVGAGSGDFFPMDGLQGFQEEDLGLAFATDAASDGYLSEDAGVPAFAEIFALMNPLEKESMSHPPPGRDRALARKGGWRGSRRERPRSSSRSTRRRWPSRSSRSCLALCCETVGFCTLCLCLVETAPACTASFMDHVISHRIVPVLSVVLHDHVVRKVI